MYTGQLPTLPYSICNPDPTPTPRPPTHNRAHTRAHARAATDSRADTNTRPAVCANPAPGTDRRSDARPHACGDRVAECQSRSVAQQHDPTAFGQAGYVQQ